MGSKTFAYFAVQPVYLSDMSLQPDYTPITTELLITLLLLSRTEIPLANASLTRAQQEMHPLPRSGTVRCTSLFAHEKQAAAGGLASTRCRSLGLRYPASMSDLLVPNAIGDSGMSCDGSELHYTAKIY